MGYEQDLKNELMEFLKNEMDGFGMEDDERYLIAEKMRNWISNFEAGD
jgi:hypothetical protein